MSEYRGINIDKTVYYGKHLLVTARQCNENILEKQAIADFIRALVDKIDMLAFGDCIVERFGQGIEVGISAAQLIETSLISMHTNDGARDMYLDVFSCKWFSEEAVAEFLKEVFSPKEITYQVILR